MMISFQPIIRACRETDIKLLEKYFSGDEENHRARLDRQKKGLSIYLIALIDSRPVGHLDIRWQGCKNEKVKNFVGECPELSAIAVRPNFRSKGIGTNLVKSAEKIVANERFEQVGIGVGIENERAKKLYERLGTRYLYRRLD
ncbi:MAG: GNAT family N-acetyltransferase [bacterium]|nr:GNAT family N-acetyltransferase [bacterium]